MVLKLLRGHYCRADALWAAGAQRVRALFLDREVHMLAQLGKIS